jgi:invasion protein IalB
MRTTSRRLERVRFHDIDELVEQWPRLAEEDAPREPHPRLDSPYGQERPRRVGARWEKPEPEEATPLFGETHEPRKRGRRGRMRWIAVIILIIAAAVLAGTFAIAQQTGKPARAEATAAQAVPTAASADETTIVERSVMGDWVYGCVTGARPTPKLCFIRQQLADSKTKAPIFTWTVGQDAKGNLVAVWQTPTGVLVAQGMLFDIGMEKPIPVPYRACMRGQCQAIANLAPDFVDRLAKAEKARATIVTASGNGLAFDFSVQGLAEGLAALKKK